MSKKRVLVVDDSATVRHEVVAILTPAGYEVLEAENGEAGQEIIGHDRAIALVICDVNMPRMSGIEMVQRVKAEPSNEALPILMLTSEGDPGLIKQAKAAGARGWVVKPFNPAHLVAAVQKLAGSA
jgi:two-component system, chemotaxis family, chemotaxis protein CheY